MVVPDGFDGDDTTTTTEADPTADWPERIVYGFIPSEQAETLGDAIDARRSDWIRAFSGRSLGDPPPGEWGVERDGGRVTAVRVEGPDAEAFNEVLRTCMHEGVTNFLVNLEKVKWVNSTGLGILIKGYTTLKKSGGELKLLKVSDRIENIFIVSKLFTVFESYQDEEEAVRSFS